MRVPSFNYSIKKLILFGILLSIVTNISFQNVTENVFSQPYPTDKQDCYKEDLDPIGGVDDQPSMNSGNDDQNNNDSGPIGDIDDQPSMNSGNDDQNNNDSGPIGGVESSNPFLKASIQRVGFDRISTGIDLSETTPNSETGIILSQPGAKPNSETGIDMKDVDITLVDCPPSHSMEVNFPELTITSTTEVIDFEKGYVLDNVLICVVTDPVDSIEKANPDCKGQAGLPGATYTLQSPGKVQIIYSYTSDRPVTVDTSQCELVMNYGDNKSCMMKFVLGANDEASSSGERVR